LATERAKMGRKIKVHRMGKYREQIEEIDLEEVKRILEDVCGRSIVIDRKTHKIITEIGPDVEEISIKLTLMGGG